MLKTILNRQEEYNNPKFLERIDIFGIGINVKFNQESKHKTRFGGFITLIIVSLLFLLFWSSIQEMIYKRNPKVVYEQKLVNNPSRFDLNKKNFSFVMTLLDSSFNPIYDESIYRFEGNFLYKQRKINADGSLGTVEFKNKVIEMELCQEDSFQVENTQNYFTNLPFQKMYCVKNIEDFYLVGQFEMDEFSVIEFRVIPCLDEDPNNKVKCMETAQKNDILKRTILQVYYSTQIVQVSNKNEPFRSVGQSYFWEANIDYQQNINLLYINTYVEDDEGLLLKDFSTRKSLVFSSERTMLSSKEDLSFFKLSLYLEKNKEQYYNRQYLKIPNAISEVGGIYNVLFAIGCIIAQPYSQMQLHRKLFNSTFQITKNNQKKQNSNNNQSSSNNKNNNNDNRKESQEIDQDDRKKNTTIQTNCSTNNKQIQSPTRKSSPVLRKLSKQKSKQSQSNIKRQISVFETNKEAPKDEQNESKKGFIKNQLLNMSVKTSEYISYYLNCFNLFKSEVYEIVNFGTKQIYNYTDICFIVNKLLEFEKLKNIVLNDEQIKLFEFIPKPKIDIQLIKNVQRRAQRSKRNKKAASDKDTEIDSQDQNSISNKGQTSCNQDVKKQFNILSMQNRSVSEKAKQAQIAFNNIYKHQEKKSKIDLKLIQMLDENLIQLFHKNTFEENNVAGSIFLFNQQNNLNMPSEQNIPQQYQANRLEKLNLNSNSNSFSYLKNKTIKGIAINSIEDRQEDQFREVVCDSVDEDTGEINGVGLQIYKNQPKNFIQHTEMRNKIDFQNESMQTRFITQKTQNQQETLNDSYVNSLFDA